MPVKNLKETSHASNLLLQFWVLFTQPHQQFCWHPFFSFSFSSLLYREKKNEPNGSVISKISLHLITQWDINYPQSNFQEPNLFFSLFLLFMYSFRGKYRREGVWLVFYCPKGWLRIPSEMEWNVKSNIYKKGRWDKLVSSNSNEFGP